MAGVFQAGRVRRAFLGSVPIVPPLQRVLPSADVSVGGWTTDTGATTGLYARVNEAARDDANYAQSAVTPSSDVWEMSLPATVDPGNNSTHQWRLNVYRYGNANINYTLDVRVGATTIATRSAIPATVDISEYIFLLSNAEVNTFRSNSGYAGAKLRITATQVP